MMKAIDYITVVAATSDELDRQVKQLIITGWELRGCPTHEPGFYCETLFLRVPRVPRTSLASTLRAPA